MIELQIDPGQLQAIADEFKASEKDLRRAFSRALSRTSRSLRTQARKELRQGLGLRSAAVLRARLQLKRFRPRGSGMGGAMLWVGTNDMPATAFKGAPRSTPGGAKVGGRQFPGAFVARGRASGKRIVFRRKGSGRLPIVAETVPIDDDADPIVAEVYDQAVERLLQNFRAEVRARTIYKVG